jgi:hypothetical protein
MYLFDLSLPVEYSNALMSMLKKDLDHAVWFLTEMKKKAAEALATIRASHG